MKHVAKLILLSLLLTLLNDSLYGQTEYFVKVDPLTGIHTKIKSIPGVRWINVNPSYITFDENNGIYFFRGDNANGQFCLYSIEASTGDIVSRPPFPVLADPKDNVLELQYDNGNRKLYGLHWDNSMNTEFLVSIDPLIGSYTIIDSIPGVKWIKPSNFTVFDERNHLFMFVGSPNAKDNYLYSVDVNTGKVISKPKFASFSDPLDNISDIKFNNTTHKLYGLHWKNSDNREYLVSIDSGTAKIHIIDSLPEVRYINIIPNYTTIDENRNRLFFRGVDVHGNLFLYSVDLGTGKILNKVDFPKLCNYQDNVVELHYSKTSDQLFALNWENPFIFTKLGDTSLCPNSSITYDIPNTAKWSNGDSGRTLRPKTTGYYSYVSIHPCTKTMYWDTLFISIKPSQTTLPDSTFFCKGTPMYLYEKNYFASYRWNPPGKFGQSVQITQPGPYILSVVDFEYCRFSDTTTVFFYPRHKPDLGSDTAICNGDTVRLSANKPYGFTKYAWNKLDSMDFKVPSTPGIYILDAMDSNSCWASDTCVIGIFQLHKPSLGADMKFCRNDSFRLSDKSGFPYANVKWNTGQIAPVIFTKTEGAYILNTIDSNSCRQSDTINIGFHPLNKPDLAQDTTICASKDFSIKNLTPYKFKSHMWSTGETKEMITVKTKGTFSLRATDQNNCTTSDTINILSKPNPVFSFGPDKLLCEGENTTLSVQINGASYLWNDGTKDSSKTITNQGVYILEVTSNGCTTNDTLKVDVLTYPDVELGPERNFCGNSPETIDAGYAQSYLWNTNEKGRIITANNPGLYWVEAANGRCKMRDSVFVSPEPHQPLYIPTAFSPNNDGNNDIFSMETNIEIKRLVIYNRWGQEIYKCLNAPFTWDGTFIGETCQAGVYMTTVEYIDCSGKTVLASHVFYLLR